MMDNKMSNKNLGNVTGGTGFQDGPSKILLREDCLGCGVCEDECPLKAIHLEGEKAMRDNDICDGFNCERCPKNCPHY